jgi:5'-deoxynucleotidase YfbR-like HD superfamily hydrolase
MSNNIFGGNAEKQEQQQFKSTVDTHSKAILNVVQRQKDLESSIDVINEKLELLDHNSVKNFRKVNDDIKNLREDIKDLRSELSSIKEFNQKLTKQLKSFATRDEVGKLEKYVDFWEPMNFVTREEMDDFREKVKEDLREIVEGFITSGDSSSGQSSSKR